MDLALAIHSLVPHAEYGGSTTANTEEAFDALRWEDSRPKPTWSQIEAAWAEMAPKAAAKATASDELLAGYVVQTEGWTLRATRDAQDSIDKLVSHVERLLGLGTITTETPVTILDASGTARQVSALRLRQIAASYGAWVLAREMVLRG